MTETECMACRTAAGDFAAEELYRDEQVVVVTAQHGVNPGHLVVVSREHVRSSLTMSDALFAHMNRVARALARRMHAALPCPSTMLVWNNEAPAQTLFHAHLHVIPRFPGDCMDERFGELIPAAARRSLAARLRPSLQSLMEGPIDA